VHLFDLTVMIVGPIFTFLFILDVLRERKKEKVRKWESINKQREAMGRKLLKLRADQTLTSTECLFWVSICEQLDDEYEQNNYLKVQSYSLADIARRNLSNYESLG